MDSTLLNYGESFGTVVFKYHKDNSQVSYPFIPASARKVHMKLA